MNTSASGVGFRLERLELFNWGTFDGSVWVLRSDGESTLVTGDIGSGKSTIVDAITTLLIPANRIAYNKAAGAETRERSLRSYVLGYYKSERSEETGSSRPLGLRDPRGSFSVILGVFGNAGYSAKVTLAQVFWFRDGNHQGQPDRFFVTSESELSIAEDFADFGTDIAGLKKQLRQRGAKVRDHFPEYGKDYRRALGIESMQAMELFHQTVSMKSVGDLNDFVRSHMLEPFNAQESIDALVAHFQDLAEAHDAVIRARGQLDALNPLLAECDNYDDIAAEIEVLKNQRAASPYFFSSVRAELLGEQLVDMNERITTHERKRATAADELSRLRGKETDLEVARAGYGGDRLAEIERAVAIEAKQRDERRQRFDRFNELLRDAELDEIQSDDHFDRRRSTIAEKAQRVDESYGDTENELTEVGVQLQEVTQEAAALNGELRSLGNRPSNIPKRSLDVRDRLVQELNLDEERLPFAGELIRVRDDCREWEGAAERLLHNFGLSLLVSEDCYRDVSDWINNHHLGTRIVYFRVPVNVYRRADNVPGERDMVRKLEIKDSPFFAWLERELNERARYACVDTMDEFRRESRAITKAGQFKGGGGRHEKNDRTQLDDRRSYVLGWDNKQKIDAILARAEQVQQREELLKARKKELQEARQHIGKRHATLAKLSEFSSFAELDWYVSVRRIDDLNVEMDQIKQASRKLADIDNELVQVKQQIEDGDQEKGRLNTELGDLRNEQERAKLFLATANEKLSEADAKPARAHFEDIRARVADLALSTQEQCDTAERAATERVTAWIEKRTSKEFNTANRIIALMGDFRQKYQSEARDMDDSLHSVPEYRALHQRLVNDDLPRFEAQFKDYLNTNVIRDIAGFQSRLNKQLDLIKLRVDTINDSLAGINYNDGRYIRLEHQHTPNVDIRDFRKELRECTTGSLDGDGSDAYSEAKFLQVKRIIERFQGREGHTEADKAWTKKVTDVRQWFVFSASERWRADDIEYEHYTDSGGKSGGQKEKLAYTILAASLAYQFKLEWDVTRSKKFRFVVIDEAFGRGSDESTRYALGLFERLGLQLLIVTPLQKIHIIEPYVAAVGFVDNQTGGNSRLQNLTITEYRQRQLARALRQKAGVEAE